MCTLISKWLNKGVILFQDSISGITPQEIINCSDSSVNLLNNDIIIIYVSYNKQFLFEPVIHINLDIKGQNTDVFLHLYVSRNFYWRYFSTR